MLLNLIVQEILWPLLDIFERNSKTHQKLRKEALDKFEIKYWDIQVSSSHDVPLYYISYVRDKVPVLKFISNRKLALSFYEKCLANEDASQVNCRRLTAIGKTCGIEYLYQQSSSEEDYKILNPSAANVVLALAWFYNNYGTEHDFKYPSRDLDKRLFLALHDRGVFDAGREPDDLQDLLYDGTDYLWEG
jgi:hypothetical protein